MAGYAWQTLTGGGLIRLLGGVVASDMDAARTEATTEHAGIRAEMEDAHAGLRDDLDEAHAGIRADLDEAIDERLAGRATDGRTQTVALVVDASLDVSPDRPLDRQVCIGPGRYLFTVRAIQNPDGTYRGRARLTSDPPGSVVDLQTQPTTPLVWGFVNTTNAACYRLVATAPVRLYWLLDW